MIHPLRANTFGMLYIMDVIFAHKTYHNIVKENRSASIYVYINYLSVGSIYIVISY